MAKSEYSELKSLLVDIEGHLRILGLTESELARRRVDQLLVLVNQLKSELAIPVSPSINMSNTKSNMWTLSYASKSNVPEEQISEECQRIISFARHRNASLGVTGFLVYRAGYFIQILEGPLENLDLLYGRIALDSRHGHLRLLHRGPIEKRVFSDWSMSFAIASRAESRDLESSLLDRLSERSGRLDHEEVLSLLSFVDFYARTHPDPAR